MTHLRIVGDVHGQVDLENLFTRGARPYLDLIADASHSVQIGDMGDRETYDLLTAQVDPARHRFFPGNHDHYDHFPPHCLGDFGMGCLNGVDFFFVRGAASLDKDKLLQVGRQLGRKIWFEQEELAESQMRSARDEYLRARPDIVLSHDAPTEIARFAWDEARRSRPPSPGAVFSPSRTNAFLTTLLEQHAPRLWIFGHHHCDWQYREDETLFVCVGELSRIEIDADGNVREPASPRRGT